MQMAQEKYQSPEAPFLWELFQKLNDARIAYCVLRNYESLPYDLDGSDVDMLVAKEKFDAAHQILQSVALRFGGRCICSYKVSASVLRFIGKNDIWWGVAIDMFPNLDYKQVDFFCAKKVIANSQDYRGIRVANSTDASITSFLKECLANLKSRKNYYIEASEAYKANEIKCKEAFIKYFGVSIAQKWGDYLSYGEGSMSLRHISQKARKALLLKAFIRQPFLTIKGKGVGIFRRYARLFYPPGVTITVLGTDGSGKSTIIEGIRSPLERALHNKLIYQHMRPNLLPSLAKLFGQSVQEGPVTNPHGSQPSGFSGSLMRLLYYTTDYVVGYWLEVYPALVKRPCIYVFDRYFYDYYIDPLRSRIYLPNWVIKLLGIFVPRPGIILCLGTDTETIHARKPELPLEEVERQLDELKSFCEKNSRAVWIDTGCSVEESINQALEAITSRMAARYHEPKRVLMKDRWPEESDYLWQGDQAYGYIALPSKRKCRWIIPLKSSLTEKALSLYLPYSSKGRVFKSIFHFMSKKGLLSYFGSHRLNPENSKVSAQFKRQVEAVFDRDDIVLALSTGTPGPFRKTTVCIMSGNGKILGYAKIGKTPLAISKIKHEASVLRKLALDREGGTNEKPEGKVKISTPECLFSGELGNAYVLIQSPPSFVGNMGSRFFNQKYGAILRTLTGVGAVKQDTGESGFFEFLRNQVEDYFVSFREQLREGLRYLEKDLDDREIIFCLSHGDFAPWNMLWNDNRVFIFDWESAVPEAPAGLDLMHFLFQTGYLLTKKRDSRLLSFILNGGKKYHSELSSTFGAGFPEIKNLLLLYLLHMAVTEDKPNQLSHQAVARRRIINLLIADGK